MDSNTIKLGDFNTSLSKIDRSSRENITKETLELNCTLDQMDLKVINRTFHPKVAEYIFFFSTFEHSLG